jgi:cytochrome b pre-mRNA-processing protein 3
MILQRLFTTPPARIAGRALFAACASRARDPAFYRDFGVPDTAEGRFELYCLHVALVLIRLKGGGARAAETAQELFDAFVRSLDDALREMGVGDLSVPKRMKKLAGAIYGRARAVEEGLGGLPDRAELEAFLERSTLKGARAGVAPQLAEYVARTFQDVASQSLEGLLEGRVEWPELVQ